MTNTTKGAPASGANGSQAKGAKNFGATFAPGFTVNVNANKTTTNGAPAQQGGGQGNSRNLLPAPEFYSPAQTRNYCNAVRAAAVALAIEVSMGAQILKATLSQVPDPEGRAFGSQRRAQRVARKLDKAADGLAAAAKNAAAAYSSYTQEFKQEIESVRHRARRPQQPRVNWADQ
ncbi:plasmid transfer protein TraA [Streptomyces sp. NPDC001816]|uniref:plasmid transfer protein TraA n=1 Tax=Streptomyces sp. NPDC001816 TaxID=3364612 RepID=UPI0036BC4478